MAPSMTEEIETTEGKIKKIKTPKKSKKDAASNAVDQEQDDGKLSTQADSKSNKKKKSKKRTTSDLVSREEACIISDTNNEVGGDFDLNEPTMAEKLATLDLVNEDKSTSIDKQEPSLILLPPSADSVHVMLKQALHADDHALLLNCLYSRDEKVISKTTALLNPSDVLKLLKALTSLIQKRGAVVVCALPWLKSVLRQHASSVASQESSLTILNSLYQLIGSRISTFQSALQLSTCLDILSASIPDDEIDDESTVPTIIYEVKDSDEEDEDEDAMETDEENEDLGDVIDHGGSDIMSD